MNEPSGEMSTDIHVPSVEMKSMSRVFPRACVTSQAGAAPVGAGVCAEADERDAKSSVSAMGVRIVTARLGVIPVRERTSPEQGCRKLGADQGGVRRAVVPCSGLRISTAEEG